MDVPRGWDDDEERDIIVTTDGFVVCGFGYHRWAVATKNDHMLLSGSGPYDGDRLITTSYRSELGGIASGLAVINILARSGKIKVKSVKLVCNNEAAIRACTRKRMHSVFHRTEGDHDLISTVHYLQESWCQDIEVPDTI
jgi:hypothetical protein